MKQRVLQANEQLPILYLLLSMREEIYVILLSTPAVHTPSTSLLHNSHATVLCICGRGWYNAST